MAKQKNPGANSFLVEAQTELQLQMGVLQRRRAALVAGGFDKDLANSAAALGRAITSLAGEMRQQEKHAKQLFERMTPEEVDSLLQFHIAELPVDRQRTFKAFLDELVGAESVL